MTFGEKIVYLRKSRGLSQDQLAEQLGVTRQSISKWERDEVIADTDRVLALSKLFGVSCDYLLDTDITDTGFGRQGFEEPAAQEHAAEFEPTGTTATVPPLSKESGSFDKALAFCKRNWYWLGLIPLLWGIGDLVSFFSFLAQFTYVNSFGSFIYLLAELFQIFPANWVILLIIAAILLFALAKIALGLFIIIWGRKHTMKKEAASFSIHQDAEE